MATIDREALPAVSVAAAPALAAALAGRRGLAVGLAALPVAVAAFFRDPVRAADRQPPAADLILAPADGKVMHAGPAQPGVAPEGNWQQVSIFLSVFDVHINRAPYGGVVTDVSYRPGRWLAAFRAESATENERSEVRVHDDRGRVVVFRQIVGLLARRVVTRVRPGDRIGTGERIGLMKFGSRMDVFVPPEATVLVRAGDRTVAGQTPIGRWS